MATTKKETEATTTTGINAKLFLFQEKVSAIKRNSRNPHFKNDYADINQILSEIKPILTECRLIISQPILDSCVHTIITDIDSGESITSSLPLNMNLKPQEIGSCITYFRRYTLSSLCSLETEKDDDANSTNTVPKVNPAARLPILEGEKLLKAIALLKAKEVTVAQIKSKYLLTAEVEAELQNYYTHGQ